MKYVLLIIIFFSNFLKVFAQDDSNIKPGWGNLDYAVPESPAFKILGTNPDNILKPTAVRNIALSIGNYFSTSGSVIPKNFAVEISPLSLNPRASLKDFNNNKFWYRMRLSFGTNLKDKGSYDLAEGIRFSLIDKTDLRTDTDFLNQLTTIAMGDTRAHDKAINFYISHYAPNKKVIEISDQYGIDRTLKRYIDSLSAFFISDAALDPATLKKIRDKKRAQLWNATIWEAGVAALQSSSDSLIKNIHGTNKYGVWSTLGLKITDKGQLLVGGKIENAMDTSNRWNTNLSGGFRLFYGSNEVRGYLQAEYDKKLTLNSASINLGCEFNISNGLWLDFAFSYNAEDGSSPYLKPILNLKFGSPEKKK